MWRLLVAELVKRQLRRQRREEEERLQRPLAAELLNSNVAPPERDGKEWSEGWLTEQLRDDAPAAGAEQGRRRGERPRDETTRQEEMDER